jgi:hydroxypyruvate reductase
MNDSVKNKLRRDAVTFFKAGIEAATPHKIFPEKIHLNNDILSIKDISGNDTSFDLKKYKRIIVIGAGKASAAMADEIEHILEDQIYNGLIVTKDGFTETSSKIEIVEASHPLPDIRGMNAAKKLIRICKEANSNDLIINLVSGGASALLPLPAEHITLQEKIETTNILLNSGATIQELNTIRKHISGIKGGRLAQYTYPAMMINLFISDVIGDDLNVIGSGLTVGDPTTFKDCYQILEKFSITREIPESVLDHLTKGRSGQNDETPKPDGHTFNHSENFILCNNSRSLNTIKSLAELNGYETTIVNNELKGEASSIGRELIQSLDKTNFEIGKKYCFLFGGESSVTIIGSGKGGRNQELCLSAAIELEGKDNVVLLSGGTDGNDGPTNAAGAICDGNTIDRGLLLGMNANDFLGRNDSFNYLNKLDDLITTGPTKTNVMDIQIVLLDK